MEKKQKKQKNHTALEKELLEALANMCENADADCPSEHRTSHFRDALSDGYWLLRKEGY